MPRWFALAAVVLASTVSVVPAASAASSGPCAARNPFTAAFTSKWNASWGGNRFSATVEDHSTGCVYTFGSSGTQFPEASVAKVEIMAAALEGVQRGSWPMTAVAPLLVPMIRLSDNNAASKLWTRIGGASGMNAASRRWGLSGTVEAPRIAWGSTLTRSADQVRLVDALVGPDKGPLTAANLRTYARSLMTTVASSQRWGVSAGVPKGWTVALKNGWYLTGAGDHYGPAGRWRINSVGLVYDSAGTPRWTIAVLGNTWRSFSTGVSAIQAISARTAAVLSAAVATS